jgi:Uncharacterized protein conserved in bacteria
MVADQVAHLAHLNARDTTLAFASRAPQTDIERVKARMGWEMPWYTITDDFDKDFGVDEWHGTNAFIRDGDQCVPHLLHQQPRRRADGKHWNYLDITRSGARRSGRTRRRATRRLRRTSGGSGTTNQTRRMRIDPALCNSAPPEHTRRTATTRDGDRG